MQRTRYANNLYVDGGVYLEGIFGWKLFPSAKASQQKKWYEMWVDQTLVELWARFTSSRVIMGIRRFPTRSVCIKPRDYTPDPTKIFDKFMSEEERMCNAEAKPEKPNDSLLAGTPTFESDKDYPTGKATGKGGDANVPYNPWVFNGSTCGASVPLNRKDTVLVHELVHALSCIAGKLATSGDAPYAYSNLEEFTAIVVTNVYLSEIGSPQLVGGHHGEILSTALTNPQAFYNQFKEPMQKVCTNHPWLVSELRNATGIKHNPFLYCKV